MIKWKINFKEDVAELGDFNELKYLFHRGQGKIIRDWIMDAVSVKKTCGKPNELLRKNLLRPIIKEYFKEND